MPASVLVFPILCWCSLCRQRECVAGEWEDGGGWVAGVALPGMVGGWVAALIGWP